MSATPSGTQVDQELAAALFARLAEDLAVVIDRPFAIHSVEVARRREKPVRADGIHLSFRVCVQRNGRAHHGCVLVPLADAVALAAYLLMAPDDVVKTRRLEQQLDRATKDALLEVGNFIAGSAETALRAVLSPDCKASAEGCQGVAAGAKPAFVYADGVELLVATARAQIHTWPAFELCFALPSAALESA
ncbi:MAG: hypothetical protein EPO68_18200 [Planctomycetota bacterium]|nr:MAG: hypothetical protein EPO68_18200 [Planctomycetota bacterium]